MSNCSTSASRNTGCGWFPPGWERFARRAVEREGDRVAVAGSSSAISPAGIHTSLRGRAWSQEVLPFSFGEALSAKGIPAGRQPLFGKKQVPIRVAFRENLSWGGFPEVVLASTDEDRRKLLREYYGAMFFRDLVERYTITNAPLLERLSGTLFSSCSRKVSLSALLRQWKQLFPFSKDLLYRYYSHVLDSTLIHETRTFSPSVHARQRNPAKVYLVDTALARRLAAYFGTTGQFWLNVQDAWDLWHELKRGSRTYLALRQPRAVRAAAREMLAGGT